jgi:hypothetical protein
MPTSLIDTLCDGMMGRSRRRMALTHALGIDGADTVRYNGRLRTVQDVNATLTNWRALVPSVRATTFLKTPPRHTLERQCHVARVPLDCLFLILEFLSISTLVRCVARTSVSWGKMVRRCRVWRTFDLAALIERSDVMVGAPAARRSDFWLAQLSQGRFAGLTCINVATSSLNSRDLRRALTASSKLESIDMSYCDGFDDVCCVELARAVCCTANTHGGNGSLRELQLNFSCGFHGHTLVSALASTSITTLSLSGCAQLRDGDFATLFEAIPSLTHMRVRGTAFTYQALAQSHEPLRLQMLDVSMCQGLTDEALSAIGKRCPRLTALVCESCVNISDAGVVAMCDLLALQPVASLEAAMFAGCGQLGDTAACALARVFARSLRRVSLDKSRITGTGARELLSLARLGSLSCNLCLYLKRDVLTNDACRRLCATRRGVLTTATQQFLGFRVENAGRVGVGAAASSRRGRVASLTGTPL